MRIDGRCHCGAIAYEAEIDPAQVMVCHCTDCQTLSGSAFRIVALTRPGSFRLLAGTMKTYVKTAESGARRLQCFCPDCGTPICAMAEGAGEDPAARVHSLRVGSIRQRAALVPKAQIWCRSALPWTAGMVDAPRYQTQRLLRPEDLA